MGNTSGDPLVGTHLREYQILDVIGTGGMGVVYRARHIYLEQERAIKVVQSGLRGDNNFTERFIREAKVLSRLRHRNVVELHDFGKLDENRYFMVLELLKGKTVSEMLQSSGKIPFAQALQIAREAAMGLQAAHEQGIVHRDVSPENLLVVKSEDGSDLTKVIDFGIARPNEGTVPRLTMSESFIGKVQYSSPEQCGLLAEGERIDHRSDVYSLGITLYEMLSGSLPFEASTLQAYVLKHVTEAPRPVSTVVAGLPVTIDRVLNKALSKKREDRYASMKELVADLDRLRKDEAPTEERPVDSDSSVAVQAGKLFAGRYLILEKLGKGGMGEVYRAEDKVLGVQVALKMIGESLTHSDKNLMRLKREVVLARKVTHPNVCRTYDIGQSGDLHYVTMELLQGVTLSELLHKRGPFSVSSGMPIVQQILSALEEAHKAGIVHRDLKPQNILVNADSHVWLMDFGISVSAAMTRVTETGVVIGTPHYMPPEQIANREMDHRADLYACGVILFEMFTGRKPYSAASSAELMLAHREADPHRPSEVMAGFPPALEKVILKCLEKEPAMRYQSATDLRKALGQLEWPDTQATRAELPAPAEKPIFRRPIVIAAMLATLSLIVWFVVSQWQTARQPAPSLPPKPSTPSMMVRINALPWAWVKVSGNKAIPRQLTPLTMNLPEGTYQVELQQDAGSGAVLKTIEVRPGAANTFVFAMPAYDLKKITAEIISSQGK